MEPGSRPSRPRGVLIAALLLLTLALAGAIALQAYRNFLGHKATASRVLHDYARLAAARFANRTEMVFYYDAFSPAVDALMRVKAGDPNVPLPPPSRLPATTQPHAPDFLKLAHYTFRYDLSSGRLETAGATPSPLVRKWLRDTLPVHSRTVYDPKEKVGAILRTVDAAPRAAVYTVVNDKAGTPRTVVGLEQDPHALEPLYKAESDQYPMLPKALTGGVTEDSFSSAIVTAADGVELYRTPVQYAPTFAARDSFEHPMMGGIRVQVALRPPPRVENLLHFSRSERQATRLSPETAPLAPLVREAVEAFAPLAAARGVTFRTELREGLVAPVDAEALRQMLVNLLDNAVKYGPAEQTITVGLDSDDGKARIRVEDQGPGVPAADRERIWDRFWRLERDRGSAVAGTGIGLSVVRELVALHGGRAWAEEGRGGIGTRFVLELPLAGQPQTAPGGAPMRADFGATA